MLTEIALTPQVFDEGSNPDRDTWLSGLEVLAQDLFRRNAAPLAVAADLQQGGWIGEVRRMIGQIKDHTIRTRVQSLSQRLKEVLVPRPGVNYWPNDEAEWVAEAIASHRTEPIGRIVMTDGLHTSQRSDASPCHALGALHDDSFWLGLAGTKQVPMDIATQVTSLRPICLHAGYLALKLHHVRGTADDDTSFAAAVFESAFRRASGFPRVQAELYVAGDGSSPEARNCVIRNIRKVLGEKLPGGAEVLLCMCPKSLDRKLVAGRLAISAGTTVRAPRWGVAFSHVARPQDSPAQMTTWSLIPTHDLNGFCRDIDADNSAVIHREVLRF